MKDPIQRTLLLSILEVLDQVGPLAQSTRPMEKRAVRDRAKLLAAALRESLPPEAYDDNAHVIPAPANDGPQV